MFSENSIEPMKLQNMQLELFGHVNTVISTLIIYLLIIYSGTPLNGHPLIADTHDITDNSESPDCPSIDFNT